MTYSSLSQSGEDEIREIEIVTGALSAMQAKYDAEHKQKVKYKMMVRSWC
jgi:hypothetical protein